MCDPLSLAIATASVGALGAGLSFDAKRKAQAANQEASNLTYASSYGALETKRVQTQAQRSEDTVSALIAGVAARGRISASASDLGSDAATVTQASNAADFAAGRSQSIVDLNAQNAEASIESDRSQANTRRVNQIMSVPKPSLASLALGITSAALSGANAYSSAGGKF